MVLKILKYDSHQIYFLNNNQIKKYILNIKQKKNIFLDKQKNIHIWLNMQMAIQKTSKYLSQYNQ